MSFWRWKPQWVNTSTCQQLVKVDGKWSASLPVRWCLGPCPTKAFTAPVSFSSIQILWCLAWTVPSPLEHVALSIQIFPPLLSLPDAHMYLPALFTDIWVIRYLLDAFIQQVNFSQSVEWDEPYVLLYHLKRIMDCGACFSCWDTCESRPNLEVVQSECVRWLLARWSTTPFKNHSPFQHLSALKGSQRRGVTKPTTQKLSEQTLKCLWGISADISPHFVLS